MSENVAEDVLTFPVGVLIFPADFSDENVGQPTSMRLLL